MNRLKFLTIALVLVTGTIQAQHINIGIKGGLNAFTISSNNNTDYNVKLGFVAGLLGHIHLSQKYAFQPEIVYSVQGSSYKISGSDSKLNLNYINIPLIFQYMYDNGFRLQAGPQVGFLTGAKFVSGSNEVDLKSSFKSTDIGVSVGMSYVKPSTGLGIDVRYNHGLTDIDVSSNKSFNRGGQLTIFYLFAHKS
ncbi:MAG: porin family protein [Saprospiraceae bacterium]